ncbi:MAG: hypothetical protein H7842_01280 [Gammaproteobacteria bacterium SHHR-1]
MSKAILPSLDAPVWSRWLLSLLLPLMAGSIWWQGQHFDPGLVQLQASAQAQAKTKLPPLPDALLGLPRFGPPRPYNADNLYEYINGHAEYYLSSGFTGLTVVEYATAGAQQPQLVANLYHMGEPLFAFGALMDELSPEAQPLEGIGSMAFASGDGLNLILGPYYIQLSRFDAQLDLAQAAEALATSLRQGLGQIEELDLSFPRLGRPLATYFVKEAYRGMGFLNQVLERQFQGPEGEFTAFQILDSAEQIQITGQALLDFLSQDGIAVEQAEHQGLSYYRVDDPYEGEWFFVIGKTRLLGTFTAPEPSLLQAIRAD